jgi:Xaa-Pro aminopeptidase
MITMENVLKRGRAVWDRDLLAEDEYVERISAVRASMVEHDLDAIVSIGHSAHTGNFTYLSASVPLLGWMSIVLGREAGPFLVSGGGSRDVPFLRTQTWISDIRTSKSLFSGPAETVADVLADIVPPGARVGLVGAAEDLAPSAHAEMLVALSRYDVLETDGLVTALRLVKRPRELAAQRQALDIARAAVADAVAAWEGGASNAEAVLAAERGARVRGARDARVLGNLEVDELAPVEEPSNVRHDRLVVFCAVEYIGYWAQACAEAGAGTEAPSAAQRTVDAMVRVASPGSVGAALADAAVDVLPGGVDDVALAYGLGGGIGLDASEAPRVVPGGRDGLPEGTVLALQAFTVDGGRLRCAGKTVRIDGAGATVL